MRKYYKKILNEKLQELVKKHLELQKLAQRLQLQEAKTVLTECQEQAIFVGNLIEQTESDNNRTIGYLEEYCEQIYQWSISLTAQTKKESNYSQILNQILAKVTAQIQSLRTEYEVVFLAYKASMWDSLESIWKAAEKDRDTTAYVIAVPYFSKGSDREYGEMICEDTKFPKEVPITAYAAYKIEERHPDIIFFHNPYDQVNVITSVHPDYYAKHLRQYTDMLVYVPYFVAKGKIKEHYCILPGVLYADKVMVETEKIRQEYINYYKRAFEKVQMNVSAEAERKFVAKGSPKYDKIIGEDKQDYELPEEWKEKVADKIVVLYNTHISKLMGKEADRTLRKIESVLRYFKKQEDFVLWWRPHPLSMETAAAVGKDIFGKYEMLVRNYKKENWGIYDDTAELYRAIVYSDAYYGDDSSLTMLYKKTGKPILIQSIDM